MDHPHTKHVRVAELPELVRAHVGHAGAAYDGKCTPLRHVYPLNAPVARQRPLEPVFGRVDKRFQEQPRVASPLRPHE